tara:strand:- start:5071 stop:6072 length:1002 start_codon:yes stop_codon:yes gene_type:complete
MFNLFPLLGFFNAFLGPIGMLSYLCGVKIFKVKFGLFDSLFLLFLITMFFINLLFFESFLVISTFRFYFGFFVFYAFFKSGGGFPIRTVLLLLLIIIPIETFMINTFVSPYDMPNFPSEEMSSHFNPGGYQRPYSFGGNASVSSSIFVILLSMVSISSIRKYIAVVCVFVFSSGSGIISLFLLFLLKRIRVFLYLLGFISIIIFAFHTSIVNYIDSLGLKVNSRYILFLVEFKLDQVTDHFNGFSQFNYAFGNLETLKEGYGGDFGWLFFVLGFGYIPFIILNVFILSKATKNTIIPIIIAIVSTFHYPVIFFLPGQIILGYLLSQKYKSSNF